MEKKKESKSSLLSCLWFLLVLGIDIDYETVGANGSMLMVATSGTAVVI